jgi:hypothetical protein
MTQVITRLYANAADAEAAVKALKAQKYGDNEIFVVGPPANGKASPESLAATIAQAAILKSDAAILAKGVAKGGTLVILHAAFGSGAKAAGLLDSHNPIPSGVAAPAQALQQHDEAAPLSSAFNWPTLLNNPTPFATFFNFPTLSDPDHIYSSKPEAILSLNDPTPLSDRLGKAVLSDSATPLSDKFGWQVLSDDPTPASNKFGWNVLK